jgi:hypothetical protein
MSWIEKVANYRHWFQTVATEVYLFTNFALVFSSMYFRFRKTTGRFLGPMNQGVCIGQRAAICSVRFTFEKKILLQ